MSISTCSTVDTRATVRIIIDTDQFFWYREGSIRISSRLHWTIRLELKLGLGSGLDTRFNKSDIFKSLKLEDQQWQHWWLVGSALALGLSTVLGSDLTVCILF